jgi:pimeloyl-ACP methyl ester carboxylesterase
MQKALGLIVLLCALGYLAACAALFLFQRSLIYYPPGAAALRAPRVSTLAMPGATVVISERPHPGPKAVIYFGGNAEDVSTSLPLLDAAFPERALYLPHYRGYAGSTGAPTEKALVADALALFDRVAATHADIVLIGRSLGTGIAVQVASQRNIARLVLVTPYDDLSSLAAARFPYFPVRWLLQDKYASGRYAPAVTAPTLLIAAQHDEIIPSASTERLLGRFRKGIASMIVIPGASHNSIASDPAYPRLLRTD